MVAPRYGSLRRWLEVASTSGIDEVGGATVTTFMRVSSRSRSLIAGTLRRGPVTGSPLTGSLVGAPLLGGPLTGTTGWLGVLFRSSLIGLKRDRGFNI